MNIDQKAAEALKLKIYPSAKMDGDKPGFEYNFKYYDFPWTLNDARCREIVREHIGIDTIQTENGWTCYSDWTKSKYFTPEYKTIAEAEIACIKAIMEASDD